MEQTWYDKYFKKEIFENKSYDSFLESFDKNKKKSMASQINDIEENYNNKIKNIKLKIKNKNNYSKLLSYELLKEELNIINLLSKYSLQNKYLEYDFFMGSLKLLLDISEILRGRIHQKVIYHDNLDISNNIPRCSYKFCNFKDSCIYNYNNKPHSICYQDHYVHNMVSADIQILMKYIKNNNNEKNILHNKEILKSINTLTYVISHMENEMKVKCMYLEKSKWEKQHISKRKINKIKLIRKK